MQDMDGEQGKRIAELEETLRLVRADIKTYLSGYGVDALYRALGVIEDARVAPPVSLGDIEGTT